MLNTLERFGGGIALDASVFINLIATDCIADILRVLPWPVRMEERAIAETFRDPRNGGSTAPLLRELGDAGLLTRCRLSDASLDLFARLTGAPAPDDLGDGEAATIALAHVAGDIVATDDVKATRICRDTMPSIRVCTTIDVFRYDGVSRAVGAERLQQAVEAARRFARMRVPFEHRPWVDALLRDGLTRKIGR